MEDIITKLDEADMLLRREIAVSGQILPGAQNRQIVLIGARTLLQKVVSMLMQVPPMPKGESTEE